MRDSPVLPTTSRRVVNESMERVDQDRVAMAAARMKQLSPGGGGVALPLLPLLEEAEEGPRKSSPDPTEVCVCGGGGM